MKVMQEQAICKEGGGGVTVCCRPTEGGRDLTWKLNLEPFPRLEQRPRLVPLHLARLNGECTFVHSQLTFR